WSSNQSTRIDARPGGTLPKRSRPGRASLRTRTFDATTRELMINFVIKRLVWSVPVLFVASVIVFAAIKATTDPTAIRSPGIRAEDMVRYREQLGLDEPAHRQYFKWLGNFVQGDLGESLRTRRPVAPELLTAMGNTLQL